MAVNISTFKRGFRLSIPSLLSFVLALSTLSAISVFTAPSAQAATAGSGNCVQNFNVSSGTGTVSVNELNGYCYVAFKNTAAAFGTQATIAWTRPTGLNAADVLVIGGGGGGGARHAGGGGAGGYVEATNYALTTSAVTVVVGGGGAGAAGGTVYKGNSGQDSAFYNPANSAHGLTARGGGYGSYNETAGSGGSGGGAGAGQAAGSVTTPAQAQTTLANISLTGTSFGNEGRPGADEQQSGIDYWAGGGGGGAGARGENPRPTSGGAETTSFSTGIASTARAGAGGAGKTPSWLPTDVATALSFGQIDGSSVYFSGGGGGGMGNDGVAGGAGGLGGGGNGTRAQATGGIPGTAFTGGGGGSSGFDDISVNTPVDAQNPPGGAGGSGVVVLRYQIQPSAPTITGITGGNGSLSVAFTAASQAGVTVTGYKYSTDNGSTWSASTGTTSSPISITGLTVGSTYQVRIRAVSAYWDGVASASTNGTAASECTKSESNSGGFTTITFATVGVCSWTKPVGVTSVRYLVVGGGGAGGTVAFGSSGGGGGGRVRDDNLTVTSSALPFLITVGAGGQPTVANDVLSGGDGGSSSITPNGVTAITSLGGGGGANARIYNFASGAGTGSTTGWTGGGGSTHAETRSLGSTGEGSASVKGGDAHASNVSGNYQAGGGGGGAGGAGASAVESTAGAGGVGIASDISTAGSFYGGGGGGGKRESSGSAGAGGNGGGGNGGLNSKGANGTANSGGGGGGSGEGADRNGGSGGSGVVIVKYANAPSIALSASTISATVGSAVSSYTITQSGGAVASYSINPALTTNGTLSFNTTTGVISGTPTATLASANYTITATNASGTSTATFSLAISNVDCSPTTSLSPPAGYTVLTFTNTTTCNWSVPSGVTTADVLIVGGGGGGGADGGGGGGGGGVFQNSNLSVTPNSSVVVKVGSGGAGGNGYKDGSGNCTNSFGGWGSTVVGCDGTPGQDSSFSTTVASGGGGGGGIESNGTADSSSSANARGGGGGGGAQNDKAGASSGGVGGFTGGAVSNSAGNAAGGGAGASANGSASSGSSAGAGGAGVTATINSIVYGSGGGGGSYNNASAALGGANAASGGSQSAAPTTPTANRGGGGGGGGNGNTLGNAIGSAGAAGVVIVRYANALTVTYDSQSGSVISGGSTITGGSISASPGTPTRDGYTFNGWFAASTGGSAISFPYTHGQTANFSLFAQWSSNYVVNVTQTQNGTILYNGTTASETNTVTSGANRTFTFTPSAGYEVESILIDGVSISTPGSPNLTNLQSAIISGYTFTNITSNRTISATYSAISASNLLLNLDGSRSSSLPAASGATTPAWTSISPGASVSATGSSATQVASNSTTTPYVPKSVYLNNNGSLTTAGSGASFNFGTTTGVSLGTTGQASAVTVEMWINPKSLRGTTNTPWNILFTKWFNSTSRTGGTADQEFHYSLKWNGTSVRQNLYTSSCSDKYGTKTFGSGADLSLNGWYLVGFTVDASGDLQFYINGKTDGTSYSGCGITIRNTSLAIIGDVIQSAGFDGSVSKVRFYKTALSAATMQSNYNADARLFAKSPVYTIIYDYDNATSGNSTLSADYILGGTTITLPTPSRTGYTFDGWFNQTSGGSKVGDGGDSLTPISNATIYAQWSFSAALNPVFGLPTATADGFTVSITNYDATYTWATPTVSTGSVAVTTTTGSTRVLTVTGLSPGASATITQNTTKAAHANGTATATGTATTGAARTPTFGTPTRTSDGFTVTITNYDAAFTWETATVTAGLVSVTSTSGSNRVLTVTGLNPGASATITQATSRSGYSSGSATATGTASATITSLNIGGVTAPVRSATPVTTVTTATGYTGTVAWAADGTPLVGNFAAGTVYTATITLTATGGYTFSGVAANSFTVTGATATNLINSGVVTAVFPATIASITYSAGTSGLGTAPASPTSVAIGGTFTTPFSLYTRAGYSFGGWSDGTNTYAANATYPSSGTVVGNVVLTAQWTGVTYTVLFEYNGRTGGDSDASKQFTTGGTAMTLPTPTRTGYTFGNWFSNVALTTSVGSAGANYEPTTNLTLYAKWNAVNYTVTYNSTNVVSGSTINSSSGTVPTDPANYNIGQSISIKSNSGSLARTGYTFDGWVTSADGTGTAVNSGQTIEMGSQSVNLYPKWTANTYTITYNLNGGSGDISAAPTSWTVGNSDVTLPTTGITRTGYNFGNGVGGYWSSTQGGAAVANTYSNVGNVTLYAIWTVKTIAYSFSEGTAAGLTIANFPTNSSSTFGSNLTLPNLTGTTVTISSNTHLFSGWSFNSTVYQSGAGFVFSEAEPTFTAIWTRLYDVKYGFAGGTKASADTEINDGDSECVTSSLCAPNQVITLRGTPTRTGYQFGGWKVQDSATVKSAGSTATITGTEYLFYAQWTPIDYVFSFNSSGGSNSFVNQTKNIGQLLTLPDPGSKAGYSFAGWSSDSGTTKLANGSTAVVGSSSQAFVAYWTPNVYTLVFDWQGATGSVSPNVNYTVGTGNLSLPAIENRVKDGYNFVGWSETSTATTVLSNYQPTTNIVLYAIWTDGNYALTLNGNGATVASEVVAVPRNTFHNLPTRTRANFKFAGWFDAATGGNFIGNAAFSYLVPASQTLYARWVQDSFYGIDEATLETASTFTASDSTGVDSTITHSPSGSSARVQIQAGALTAGTVISVRYFKETSRQQSLIGSDKSYFFSILVSWILGSGSAATVPNTAAGKPILVTLSNSAIRAGAMVYRVIGGVATELQRATVDGSITVELTSDPELVIAAIKPTAPVSVAASSAGIGSSDISWLVPTSNGGSAVIEYTASVANDSSKSCTTATLTCMITGLSNGTTYSFVVTATNGVGTSPDSSPANAATGSLYAVTFDAKSGTLVSSGSFYTASTVSEPAAPTRSGYTFAGWSAVDGGSAVTFPYAPGVTTDITLFARWTASSHSVSFDSKSGSSVTSGTFVTDGTVTAPTAPTRSGYTFAGWSATDGGTAVTFPYTPGVVTGITLFAKWTAVISGGGDGSTAPSSPAPSEPVTQPSTPVKRNVTTVAPVIVVGDKDAKVIAIDIQPASKEAGAKPPVLKVDVASEKFISAVKVVDGKLVLTPETGFSGKKIVTVTITESGVDRIVQIPLTVLPEGVAKPVLTPTASNKSIIRWNESPNATTYTVLLNGKRVCSTSALSCSVPKVLGPDSVIEIISNGGDRTVSEKIEADFRQNVPVTITRLVSATITKASLTSVDTKALDKVTALIKSQGFGTVVISEITTTSKTKALAAARIESIKKYINSEIGTETVEFEITPVKSRTYFNNISLKG